MTDSEFAELRALWDASSIEVAMDPPRPTARECGGEVVLRDVEFEDVALVYDAGHHPGTTNGAMANARLIAWLLDHSWSLVYDDSDAARREVVDSVRECVKHGIGGNIESPCCRRVDDAVRRLDAAEAEENRQGRSTK